VSSDQNTIKLTVRDYYAGRARQADDLSGNACCDTADRAICGGNYDPEDLRWLPDDAQLFTLGCGNPTALAELQPGETVLDFGSGAGLDVLLSARRVGPEGIAYGLDMTDEMLEVAQANQEKAGVANARFLKGEMENVPLPDASVDVIISNCVVNLSPDKDRVLGEAFRVLKPGGRIAISDIVVRGEIPAALRSDLEAWSGCIAGALSDEEYTAKLHRAGFDQVDIETTRTYSLANLEDAGEGEAGNCWKSLAPLPRDEQERIVSRFTSSFIRAQKPVQGQR
jgi:SAM-dependent methyltransferase